MIFIVHGTVLTCVAVSIQSDVFHIELQQHLVPRWNAFQHCIVHKVIK